MSKGRPLTRESILGELLVGTAKGIKAHKKRQAEAQAPEHKYYCTELELSFLHAIRASYLRFRREWDKIDKYDKTILYKDDVVTGFLNSEDSFSEGDNSLINDLEHVVRAWEEKANAL